MSQQGQALSSEASQPDQARPSSSSSLRPSESPRNDHGEGNTTTGALEAPPAYSSSPVGATPRPPPNRPAGPLTEDNYDEYHNLCLWLDAHNLEWLQTQAGEAGLPRAETQAEAIRVLTDHPWAIQGGWWFSNLGDTPVDRFARRMVDRMAGRVVQSVVSSVVRNLVSELLPGAPNSPDEADPTPEGDPQRDEATANGTINGTRESHTGVVTTRGEGPAGGFPFLALHVLILGQWYNALIDGGSSRSFIAERCVSPQQRHRLVPAPLTAEGFVEGHAVTITHLVHEYLHFQTSARMTIRAATLHVCPQLQFDLILGLDWLRQNGVQVDYGENRAWMFREGEIPLLIAPPGPDTDSGATRVALIHVPPAREATEGGGEARRRRTDPQGPTPRDPLQSWPMTPPRPLPSDSVEALTRHLDWAHLEGGNQHAGVAEMFALLAQREGWEGRATDVRDYVAHCPTCQRWQIENLGPRQGTFGLLRPLCLPPPRETRS